MELGHIFITTWGSAVVRKSAPIPGLSVKHPCMGRQTAQLATEGRAVSQRSTTIMYVYTRQGYANRDTSSSSAVMEQFRWSHIWFNCYYPRNMLIIHPANVPSRRHFLTMWHHSISTDCILTTRPELTTTRSPTVHVSQSVSVE